MAKKPTDPAPPEGPPSVVPETPPPGPTTDEKAAAETKAAHSPPSGVHVTSPAVKEALAGPPARIDGPCPPTSAVSITRMAVYQPADQDEADHLRLVGDCPARAEITHVWNAEDGTVNLRIIPNSHLGVLFKQQLKHGNGPGLWRFGV